MTDPNVKVTSGGENDLVKRVDEKKPHVGRTSAGGPGVLGNRVVSSLPCTDRLPDGDVEAVPDIDVGHRWLRKPPRRISKRWSTRRRPGIHRGWRCRNLRRL